MKRTIICLAVILLLSGCAAKTPETVELTPVATTAAPTVAPTPSPSPTPEPTPTPTPDPYEGLEHTYIADGFFYVELTDEMKTRITGLSYPAEGEECLIGYSDLRYVGVRYYDFDGVEHDDGELIVNKGVAGEVAKIFLELYEAKYPFTSIILVDEFGQKASDSASMAANNTSAFNYRLVNGTHSLSKHSYGLAIDVNPLINPYVNGKNVAPPEGRAYLDRTKDVEGMIDHDDLAYKVFTSYGWLWGGDWSDPDYQHFYKQPADYGY